MALALAFSIDALHREWPSVVHPVAWLGRGAAHMEARLHRPSAGPAQQLAAGVALVGVVVVIALSAVGAARVLTAYVGLLRLALDALVLAACCTLSGLIRAAEIVRRALVDGDLGVARRGLRSLCSRDPSELEAEELSAAAVESVAENTSDSWVAPLFWYALLGWPGAVAYRSVNTLDAMYGYRGEREWFGKAAARLDDLMNLAPARLTALLLWVLGPSDRRQGAWQVFLRDRNRTASPNAGQPMAMMAGLLGVRLTKRGCYALGDAERPCDAERLAEASRIAKRAGIAFAGVVLGLELFV